MKMLSSKKSQQIKSALQPFLWDYILDPIEVYTLLKTGKKGSDERFRESERLLLRLFERMPWYQLISVFGMSFIRKKLTNKIIAKMRDPLLKEHYATARCILRKQPVPFSGWRPEYRKKIKATLLSDRRYRIKILRCNIYDYA